MKTRLHIAILLLTLLGTLGVRAQGTAFTYAGQLHSSGNRANGLFDLTFSVWDAPGGPARVGGPITNSAVLVSNGMFMVKLDFGPGVYPGEDRWLEIGIRTNGVGGFTLLRPREGMNPSRHAICAENAQLRARLDRLEQLVASQFAKGQ